MTTKEHSVKRPGLWNDIRPCAQTKGEGYKNPMEPMSESKWVVEDAGSSLAE